MADNPYQAPAGETLPAKPIPWGRASLVGLVVMLASALVAWRTGDFRGSGVTFYSAPLALSLIGAFCLGATILLGSGIGWLVSVCWSGLSVKRKSTT